MRVQAEPTEIVVNFTGGPARVWNAVTEDGEQVFLFVVIVGTANDAKTALVEKLIPVEIPPLTRV